MRTIAQMIGFSVLIFGLVGCPDFRGGDRPRITEPIPVLPHAGTSGISARAVSGDLVALDNAPPPISGGTLAALQDGNLLAADPDRDRLILVNPSTRAVLRTIALRAGDEPGRVAETASHHALVLLRGTGELLHVESNARNYVCDSPRGIAATESNLWITCRGGELLALDAEGTAVEHRFSIVKDLRDVVAIRGRLFVSTFRQAHVLEVSPTDGRIIATHRLPDSSEFAPSVAYRLTAIETDSNIQLVLSHQLAAEQEVDTQSTPSDNRGGGSSYGGGDSSFSSPCDGIVRSAVTVIDIPMSPVRAQSPTLRSAQIANATLPVDIAVFAGNDRSQPAYALVAAGNQENLSGVKILRSWEVNPGACSFGTSPADAAGIPNAIAVARLTNGDLAVQLREPSEIRVYRMDSVEETSELRGAIALGGESRFDTGHALFHGAASGTIACASCHAEGTDDGRTWRFTEGLRRTPPLFAGISTTAPFHWSGDQANFARLMDDVFVRRMGGPRLATERANALESWVDRMPEPARRHESSSAIERGRELFAGAAQCSSCHSGAHFTNNQNANVGTGGMFQVPALVHLRDRLPLMHNGCATTIAARFDDPSCGGTQHGSPTLSGAQKADLVAYLETL